MRYLPRLELLGGLLISAGLFSACSLVYDLSADQCEVKADCDALGGEFRGRECRAGVCIVTGATGGNGGGGGMDAGGCKSTKECQDDPTVFADSACIDGECIALANIDAACPLVVPSDPQQLKEVLSKPGEPIIFGAFGVISQGLHSEITRNYDLAFTEFNDTTEGLPGPNGRRGLVAVICETPLDDDRVVARAKLDGSMDHLVQTLKVPGIVPTLFADDLQYAFERELQRDASNAPFFLSAFESDSTLVNLPADNGLLWHILPTGEEVALAYKPLLTRVLDSLALAEPARVALVTTQDIRATSDMRTTVVSPESGIVFNGGTVDDNDSTTFQEFLIRTTDSAGDLAPDVTALLEFKPHVIIALGANEFVTGILTPLESQWNAATEMAPRPFYLFSPYQVNISVFASKLQVNQLRQRTAGVNSAKSKDLRLYNTYVAKFKAAYASDMFDSYDDLENFYDPAYYMIYSAAAVTGNTPGLKGADLVRGMNKITDMSSSQVFGVGTEDISKVLNALGLGSIRLDGTLGPPNFDDNGGRKTPGSVWCVDSSNQFRTDVLTYDEATGELELGQDKEGNTLEELPCIADF
jgi:hypothetical protein